jgi:predicted lactoylglutathione lyase
MTIQVFVDLPVRDLERCRTFFSDLGFGFNARFSDQNAACMIVSDTIHVVLPVESLFRDFTRKPVADARKGIEALACLSTDQAPPQ